jgi:predicted pyridoxine 5'-phosphate oxidase superfamily flavin-nucleotide-binding protein
MAKITDEMKRVLVNTGMLAVATATPNGEPNVVPVHFGKVLSDDEFLLVHNYMKKTMENIKANPRVAISVWKRGDSEGYQFKGDARIETSGKVFDEGVKMVKAESPQLNPEAAIIVKVDSIYVTTPGRDAGKQVG